MRRSLVYAMIPIGFILLMAILLLSGFWTHKVTDEPPTVVDEPPAKLDDWVR